MSNEVKITEERIAQAHAVLLGKAYGPFNNLLKADVEEQEALRAAVFNSFLAVVGAIGKEEEKIKQELNCSDDDYVSINVYGELQLVSTAFNAWLHDWDIDKVPGDSLWGEKIGEFAMAVGELMTRYAVSSVQYKEAWDCNLGWFAKDAIEADAKNP